jgi:hypothetical protein
MNDHSFFLALDYHFRYIMADAKQIIFFRRRRRYMAEETKDFGEQLFPVPPKVREKLTSRVRNSTRNFKMNP